MKRFVLFVLIGLYTSSIYAQVALCEKYINNGHTCVIIGNKQTI